MAFKSWMDFDEFEVDVRQNRRFILSQQSRDFLGNVAMSLASRVWPLPSNATLFRSQIGYIEEQYEAQTLLRGFPANRMKPLERRANEGRANPKGIPYLYLSGDPETSMAELRPHVGQFLSSAAFKVGRDLRIVNCHSSQNHYSYERCIFSPPTTAKDIDSAVWSRINDAFAKPVSNNDSSADYVPTQILTELFRSEAFDGLCFKSSLGNGYNIVLFDLNDAHLISCTVMEAKSIRYEFKECANRYFIQGDE